MSKSIKDKTVLGLFHSFIGLIGNQSINFIIGIILARLLTPSDYGLLGMVTVFISISSIFVDSGMTTALIREKEITENDYSTVFIYNLIISCIFYIILFILSKHISNFFNEPNIIYILRIVSLNVIIGAFGNIQKVKLTKELNFKSQAKVEIFSIILSGSVGIFLAFSEKGVWSLIIMNLLRQIFISLAYMLINKWHIKLVFDYNSFKRLFNFGYKMLITAILANIYHNIFNLILGRSYSKETLGYYAKGKGFKDLFSNTLVGTVTKVVFPVLSEFQDDKEKFSKFFKELIKHMSYLTLPIFLGLIAISKPLILLLFGLSWEPMILYFRILCISSILFPNTALNLNILQVVGRSDLFLRIDIIKIIIGIILIFISILLKTGLWGLFGVIVVISVISFIADCHYSKFYINYSLFMQIKDLLIPFSMSLIMSLLIYFVTMVLPLNNFLILIISIPLGIFIYSSLLLLFKVKEFYVIIDFIKKKLFAKRIKKKI